MENYTIYCTEEQTKKALELGAPINIFVHAKGEDKGNYKPIDDSIDAIIPTAEQMISWLEEQEEISDLHIYKMIQSWTFELYAYNGDGNYEHPLFQSRKGATLAAIDAALDYLNLINKKK